MRTYNEYKHHLYETFHIFLSADQWVLPSRNSDTFELNSKNEKEDI